MESVNPLYMAMYEMPYHAGLDKEPSGSSIERLRDAVDAHARAEAESLGQYEHIAQASGDPAIALVMRLVLEDEERHHGLLRRIEATLSDTLNWTRSSDALPTGTPSAQETESVASLAALAHELVNEERTGAKFLRKLAEEQKSIDGGLPSLLIETMAMDSEKHARLLQFVQQRLERRTAA
jgi:rubrerythrin